MDWRNLSTWQRLYQTEPKISVEFCVNVYKRIKNLVVSTDRPLNSIFFSIYQLEWFIINSTSADKHGLTQQVDEKAIEIISKTIIKFTTFEDTNKSFGEWENIISFCSYLISWIDKNDFNSIFKDKLVR